MVSKKGMVRGLFSMFAVLFSITAFPAFGSGSNFGEGDSVVKEINIRLIEGDGWYKIKWSVKGQDAHDLFQLQRSHNGGEFVSYEFEQGFQISPSVVISHVYIDKNPPQGLVSYRIRNLNRNKFVMCSDTVSADSRK